LLPDLPWDRFKYLGNTSVLGATYSLLSRDLRREVAEIANKMTYLELSADNRFMDQFMSALFLPHTDTASFPSVIKLLEKVKSCKSFLSSSLVTMRQQRSQRSWPG